MPARNKYYQDIWINGEITQKGDRGCKDRYEVLKRFLQRYKQFSYFKVLDFGANMGYFSYRTASDFPNSHVTLVDYEPLLPSIHTGNNLGNTVIINKYMGFDELKSLLKEGKFDLVYLMSVLHHFGNFGDVLELFLKYCGAIVVEVGYPSEVPLVNSHLVKPIFNKIEGLNPVQINSWVKHDRPIFYLNTNEEVFNGVVHNGCKDAGTKTIPTINEELRRLYGSKMYEGTLNISIDKKLILKEYHSVSGVYKIIPAFLNGLPTYLIRTQLSSDTEVEILSPYYLRDCFGLENGDHCVVSVDKKYIYEYVYKEEYEMGWRIDRNMRPAKCCATCEHGMYTPGYCYCEKNEESVISWSVCNDYDISKDFTLIMV